MLRNGGANHIIKAKEAINKGLSMDMYFQYGITNSDPERIAAQVITGIGFLGAGTILANQKERNVKGLTTAASIWAVAAVGLVVGAGYIVTAVAATFLVFIVLTIFIRVDDLVRRHRERQYTFHIIMRNTVGQSRRLADFFKKEDIQVESFQSIAAEEQPRAELIVSVSTFRDVHDRSGIYITFYNNGVIDIVGKLTAYGIHFFGGIDSGIVGIC